MFSKQTHTQADIKAFKYIDGERRKFDGLAGANLCLTKNVSLRNLINRGFNKAAKSHSKTKHHVWVTRVVLTVAF